MCHVLQLIATWLQEVDLPNPIRIKCRQFFKHKYTNNTLKEGEVGEILDQMTEHLRMEAMALPGHRA